MSNNWVLSALILVAAFFLHRSLHLLLRKTLKDRDVARTALSVTSNIVWIFAGILLLNTWMEQLRNLWLSLAALGAGLAIVNKELIMNMAGHFVRMASGGLATGDVIRIANVTGKVLSYDLMNTKILVMGPSGMFTGQVVLVPNNMLITHPVHHLSFTGLYSVEAVRVPVSPDSDIAAHIDALQAAATAVSAPYLKEAQKHFNRVEREIFVGLPTVEPKVFIEPVSEKQVDLVLRLAVTSDSRVTLTQEVLRRYYANLQAKGDDGMLEAAPETTKRLSPPSEHM